MEPSKTKIAVVTGAGSGIGRAVSLALLRSGYSVALMGRRVEALEGTAAMAYAESPNAVSLVIPADIGQPEHVRTAFSRVHAEFGRLDLLFNNAGIAAPGVPFDEITDDQWRAVVDVNF
ncbi:MAG: SDR family NAD(P)-dependent oxidoreductase, partial [Acidobacteriota bacterium]